MNDAIQKVDDMHKPPIAKGNEQEKKSVGPFPGVEHFPGMHGMHRPPGLPPSFPGFYVPPSLNATKSTSPLSGQDGQFGLGHDRMMTNAQTVPDNNHNTTDRVTSRDHTEHTLHGSTPIPTISPSRGHRAMNHTGQPHTRAMDNIGRAMNNNGRVMDNNGRGMDTNTGPRKEHERRATEAWMVEQRRVKERLALSIKPHPVNAQGLAHQQTDKAPRSAPATAQGLGLASPSRAQGLVRQQVNNNPLKPPDRGGLQVGGSQATRGSARKLLVEGDRTGPKQPQQQQQQQQQLSDQNSIKNGLGLPMMTTGSNATDVILLNTTQDSHFRNTTHDNNNNSSDILPFNATQGSSHGPPRLIKPNASSIPFPPR